MITRDSPSRSRGMTLIETMVALAVLTMMLTTVWSSFRGTMQGLDASEKIQKRYSIIRNGMARITSEMSMAYLSFNRPAGEDRHFTLFEGRDSFEEDSVTFSTFSHLRIRKDADESDQTMIQYFVADDVEDTSRKHLYRRESRRLTGDLPERLEDYVAAYVLIEDVVGFDVKYWDATREEWLDEWATMRVDQQPDRLPPRVKIKLKVMDLDEDAEPLEFTAQTALFMQEKVDLEVTTELQPRSRPPAKEARRERGIAVLLVVACLAVLAPFTATFNYQARVDWQSAINVRDEVAARNIQRGAVRLSLLLFELQRMVFNQKQFRDMVGSMDITQVAPYLMSVFGTPDGAEGLGALVGVDATALGDLSLGGGDFEVRLHAESGKINVNCLSQQGAKSDAPARGAVETLEALMLPTLYNPLFEEEKKDGERYSRLDIIRAIADYVDEDTKRFDVIKLDSGSAGERYRYQERFDPYEARNGRMDSVEELHLVEGIDDDWMAAFADELTVYGDCKVNLNFASPEQIAFVLRHTVAQTDKWKTEGDEFLLKTMPLANYIVEFREFSLFKSLKDFDEFVAKPDQFVSPLATMTGDSSEQNQSNLPRIPEGMEIRTNGGQRKDGTRFGGLKDVSTVAPERVYRTEIITSVGAVKKRLTAVYDMQYPRSQRSGKGAWLYYRED